MYFFTASVQKQTNCYVFLNPQRRRQKKLFHAANASLHKCRNNQSPAKGHHRPSLRLVRNPSERFQTSWNDNHKERDLRRTTLGPDSSSFLYALRDFARGLPCPQFSFSEAYLPFQELMPQDPKSGDCNMFLHLLPHRADHPAVFSALASMLYCKTLLKAVKHLMHRRPDESLRGPAQPFSSFGR
jgi:hypothetical protein